MAINWNNAAQWVGIAGNFLRGSVAEGIKKEMENSHGFDGEAIKEATLQETRNRGFIDPPGYQKIRRVEKFLRGKGEIYFQNYCDVLKEFSKLPKPISKEEVTGTGAKQKIVKIFNPDWISPGVRFFIDLVETHSDEEAHELLGNVGIFQDAPYGGIRTAVPVLRWLKEKGYTVGVGGIAAGKVFTSTNVHIVDESVDLFTSLVKLGMGFVIFLVIFLFGLIVFLGMSLN